jgi:phosphoglycolate phosphatase-like HAD superfamily hydrolase
MYQHKKPKPKGVFATDFDGTICRNYWMEIVAEHFSHVHPDNARFGDCYERARNSSSDYLKDPSDSAYRTLAEVHGQIAREILTESRRVGGGVGYFYRQFRKLFDDSDGRPYPLVKELLVGLARQGTGNIHTLVISKTDRRFINPFLKAHGIAVDEVLATESRFDVKTDMYVAERTMANVPKEQVLRRKAHDLDVPFSRFAFMGDGPPDINAAIFLVANGGCGYAFFPDDRASSIANGTQIKVLGKDITTEGILKELENKWGFKLK